MKSKLLIYIILLNTVLINAEVLKFSDAYEHSLQNAHSLKASSYRYESGKARISKDKAFMFPRLNLNLSLNYDKDKYKVLGEYDKNKKRIAKEIEITLTQTIYDRERYKILESTRIKSKQLKTEDELNRQKLSTKILEHYMDILKSYTKIRLYKTFIKYHKSLLKFNQKNYKLGLIGKADLLKEKVALNSMEIDLKREKNILNLHKNNLNRYLGFSDYKLPKLKVWQINSNILKKMSGVVNDKDNIYSNLAYQIQSENIQYLQKLVEASKSGHYPKVNLQASSTKYYTHDSSLEREDSVSLNLNIPIFEGGHTQARIKIAKFDLLEAKENLISLEKDIEISYKQYLADFKAAKDSIVVNKKSYFAAKEYSDTIQKGYKKELNSIIELYDAQNQLADIEVRYIESVYGLLDSYINILIVTNRLDNLYIIDKILG